MSPLPTPEPNETMRQFVNRVIDTPEMVRRYPKGHDRRQAAQHLWKREQVAIAAPDFVPAVNVTLEPLEPADDEQAATPD